MEIELGQPLSEKTRAYIRTYLRPEQQEEVSKEFGYSKSTIAQLIQKVNSNAVSSTGKSIPMIVALMKKAIETAMAEGQNSILAKEYLQEVIEINERKSAA